MKKKNDTDKTQTNLSEFEIKNKCDSCPNNPYRYFNPGQHLCTLKQYNEAMSVRKYVRK